MTLDRILDAHTSGTSYVSKARARTRTGVRGARRTDLITRERLALAENLSPLTLSLSFGREEGDEQVVQVGGERRGASDL